LAPVVSTGRTADGTATAGDEASDRYAALLSTELLSAALVSAQLLCAALVSPQLLCAALFSTELLRAPLFWPRLLRTALFRAQRPQRELGRRQEQRGRLALRREWSPSVRVKGTVSIPGSQGSFLRAFFSPPNIVRRPGIVVPLIRHRESVAYPSYPRILAKYSPDSQRGFANSAIASGQACGPAFGMLLARWPKTTTHG
jgi:hypothetical protein